jgi:PBSX family phage terminase large subunit
MPTLTIGQPNPRQELFLESDKKFIGFGGARGGGKSWAIRTKAVLLGLAYPGIKCMIVRKTYPELTENHINPICEMLKCYHTDKSERLASYNDSKKNITFPNGSRILFRYCDNEKDAERFQGTEVDVLFIDEATHQSEDKYKKLSACVRGVNNFPKRIYLSMNPGGEGHHWVKRLFVDKRYVEGENPDDYVFIQSLVTDNKALMESNPDYIRQLEALPPKLRKAWLEGSWDLFDGMFFEEFKDDPEHYEDRQWTHVIAPFEVPKEWKIYRSFDWGYSKPFSCAWWAIDYDGVAYRILELYGCTKTPNEGVKWIAPKVFAEIQRIENEHRWLKGKQIFGVADPAIFSADGGESIAETAQKYGVYFRPGDNQRIPGWMQIHYRMAFDENGYPMMYVFNNCKGFIRTIPTLLYDEHKVEDLDTEGEDHVADETRYFCMSRPIKPRQAAIPDDYINNPLYVNLDIPKENLTKRTQRPRIEIITEGE